MDDADIIVFTTAPGALLPHPLSASLGWVGTLTPAERMSARARDLLTDTRDLAAAHHDRRPPQPRQPQPRRDRPGLPGPADPVEPE
ncbi:MAG: hypothetical protein H7146_09030 [Burkholderiaceae bacterium]|nr:hypothetical protein [Microbacteriaceae bacterium]